MRFGSCLLTLLLVLPAATLAGTVSIEANHDATLIESPNGSRANGSGPALFAGRTSQEENSRRRGLLSFDVASVLPADARIESASLTLYMNPSNPASRLLRLHRVQAAWSEGPSFSGGGGGAPAGPGDATWIHTSYDDSFWVRAGGQFLGRVSAETEVSLSGHYTWEGGLLLEDVRLWLSNPQRNLGWILLGDEDASQTAKSFASREHADPSLRPVLEITYR
jgi:hypothetical protein